MFLLIWCYAADLILGDPEWMWHPVKALGKAITFLDKKLRTRQSKWSQRLTGAMLALSIVGISAFGAYLIIKVSGRLNPLLGKMAWIYLGYTTLSIKDLFLKAKAVLWEIEAGSLLEARRQLSKIVGRDTQKLSEEKIIRAAVESVAENTSDGIIAPLFYLTLGGPVLAIIYKAINTLDSMVGYKNKKYVHFGWFSAKLDDIANFIPARITGFLISVSSFILGKNFKNTFRVMLRDGRKHLSPNSGISEAAMAGALGIKLGGPSIYEGQLKDMPYLGNSVRLIKPSLINEALRVSFMASFLMLLAGVFLRWIM